MGGKDSTWPEDECLKDSEPADFVIIWLMECTKGFDEVNEALGGICVI